MSNNLSIAKNTLENGDYSCVLYNGRKFFTSNERGIIPLIQFLDSAENFCGFSAADKIVGKAAAFVYTLMEIEEIYAKVITFDALLVLEKNSIYVSYQEAVPAIINRTGNGICPIERAVENVDSPKEAVHAIKFALENL